MPQDVDVYHVKWCTALAHPIMHRHFRSVKAIRVMQETQLSLTNRATHCANAMA